MDNLEKILKEFDELADKAHDFRGSFNVQERAFVKSFLTKVYKQAHEADKEKIKLDNGEAHIIDGVCVNSKHRARFLANENEEYCQCSFGDCKVRVSISYNGHDPYMYILTQQEIENLPTKK